MSAIGIITRDGQLLSTEECLHRSRRDGQVDGYPYAALALMLSYPAKVIPSASMVASDSKRRTILENILDYYVNPDSVVSALRGTLIHRGFDTVAISDVKREKEIVVKIPGTKKRLSGRVDIYFPDRKRIEDYKTCSKIPEYVREPHYYQLVTYSWILRWAGYEVEDAVINYVAWNSIRQERWFDELEKVSDSYLFQNEEKYIKWLIPHWDLLHGGLIWHKVPSMTACNIRYCRYCQVKWACDRINKRGETIEPGEWMQEDYYEPSQGKGTLVRPG